MCRKSLVIFAIFLLLLVAIGDCKKTIGRSRGCRGSCTNFGRSKVSKKITPMNAAKPATPKATKTVAAKPEPKALQPKPSAPNIEPTVKKQEATKVQSAAPPKTETVNKQQATPLNNQNNNNNNNPDPSRIGWNTGTQSGQYAPNAPPPQSQPLPSHQMPHGQQTVGQNAAPPPYAANNAYGQPPYYQHSQPPAYSPQQAPVYNPMHGQPPPPYSAYPQTPYNHGYNGMQPPPTYNGMQGYGPPPPYNGYGNYQGGSRGGGLLGNIFGGGGGGSNYGGGTFLGSKYGNYNMVKPRGFGFGFGKVLRNVAAGFLIWHVVSGLTRSQYRVHNYYNNPETVPQEMQLPANIITLCEESVTALCAENTTPLCTANNTVLCVVLMPATTPCSGDTVATAGGQCVTTTVPCKGHADDPDCKGDEGRNITVTLPCVSNATVHGDIDRSKINVTMNVKNGAIVDGTVLCVTTMAEPVPEVENFNCGNGTQTDDPANCPIVAETGTNLTPLNETQTYPQYPLDNSTRILSNTTQADIDLSNSTTQYQ